MEPKKGPDRFQDLFIYVKKKLILSNKWNLNYGITITFPNQIVNFFFTNSDFIIPNIWRGGRMGVFEEERGGRKIDKRSPDFYEDFHDQIPGNNIRTTIQLSS